jgi:hypothetical protein
MMLYALLAHLGRFCWSGQTYEQAAYPQELRAEHFLV